MSDMNFIVVFGLVVQVELQIISQLMLDGVCNKDVGFVGDSFCDIVIMICGFFVSEFDMCCKISFWEKLLGCVVLFVKFIVWFEEV